MILTYEKAYCKHFFNFLTGKNDFPCRASFVHIDVALVAAATEAQGGVSLGLDERSIHEHVQFTHDIEQGGICQDFLPSVASVAPHVVTEFLFNPVDEGASAHGL